MWGYGPGSGYGMMGGYGYGWGYGILHTAISVAVIVAIVFFVIWALRADHRRRPPPSPVDGAAAAGPAPLVRPRHPGRALRQGRDQPRGISREEEGYRRVERFQAKWEPVRRPETRKNKKSGRRRPDRQIQSPGLVPGDFVGHVAARTEVRHPNLPRSCGAAKSSCGPTGTMPVGFTRRWLK